MLDKNRIRRLHASLSGAGLMSQKKSILSGFGVESSKDLTAEQADEIIERMNAISKVRKKTTPPSVRKARSTVLTLINVLGIYAYNGDWSRVNQFLLNPRIAGKLMYEMNLDELNKLQKKLRAMIRKRKKEEQELNYQATNN